MIKIFTLPLYLSLAALIIGAQQPVYFKMLLHSLCPDRCKIYQELHYAKCPPTNEFQRNKKNH